MGFELATSRSDRPFHVRAWNVPRHVWWREFNRQGVILMQDSEPDADIAYQPNEEYAAMVLMVDDQAMIGEAVRRMLADQHDIDFHYCSDPRQALRDAERIKPTVILQDLVLPGVDGLSLVRAYRGQASTRDVPVIVLSTKEDPITKRDSFKAGAHDYLIKLPDALELVARIRHHTRAYLNQVQRDDAYRALRQSQQKLMEINLELQRLSTQDGLTGLSNRRHFDAYLEAEWLRAMRERTSLSLMMVDVDNFKTYNDTYGHLSGDDVLRRVGETMLTLCRRSGDLAARFGGEEFVMVLPATPLEGARVQAQRVCDAISVLQIEHKGTGSLGHVTVSIGVSTHEPALGDLASAVLTAADHALYDAKHAGKNRIVARTPALAPTGS